MYIKSSVAVFAVSLVVPALGQGQQAGVSGLDLLEEVVVTARKREENLKDVPVSISETLGYTFNLNRTDFLGPDDWVSTDWYGTTPWAQCANWLTPLGTWYIRGEWNCDGRYGDVPDGGVPANTVPSNQPIAAGLTFDDVHPYDIIDPGVTQHNDRFHAQFNVEFASGSLEVLTLYALSESLNWRDNDITDSLTGSRILRRPSREKLRSSPERSG